MRINGRTVRITDGEEAEVVWGRINRAAAVAEVWKRDPSWRPQTSLYATPRGAIEALDEETRAAEEELVALNGGKAIPGYVWRDGTGRRSDAEICRPNGEWVGGRFVRAGADVTTVEPSEFKSIWHELSAGARPLPPDPRYKGIWLETREGSVVGLRYSILNGWTTDLRSGPFYRSSRERMKIHTHRDFTRKAMPNLPILEVQGYEFSADDKPMWDILGAALRSSDDPVEQRAFVRTCILKMLETGAVPYEYRSGLPYGMDTSRWDGKSPEAIADDIVEATFAAPDIFEANIWWVPHRYE